MIVMTNTMKNSPTLHFPSKQVKWTDRQDMTDNKMLQSALNRYKETKTNKETYPTVIQK